MPILEVQVVVVSFFIVFAFALQYIQPKQELHGSRLLLVSRPVGSGIRSVLPWGIRRSWPKLRYYNRSPITGTRIIMNLGK